MENKTLRKLIEEQQSGHENEPLFTVGLQLLEIAEKEPTNAEIIEKDLTTEGMKLADAAQKLKQYADKNHGKASCFCITPKVAETILREFYAIPAPAADELSGDKNEGKNEDKNEDEYIDLSAFL